ncbi:MAG: 30S ribosomal protein S6 [Eubacteriaceae bacterium]|nr:30S ribosomal protein S6 [Eubacteriaceae bacterium]
MNSYETMFIVNPNLTEEENDAEIARIQAVIEEAGEVGSVDKWGKKKLAYPIMKFEEGYFNIIDFKAETKILAELDHVFKVTENILRGIYVRKED